MVTRAHYIFLPKLLLFVLYSLNDTPGEKPKITIIVFDDDKFRCTNNTTMIRNLIYSSIQSIKNPSKKRLSFQFKVVLYFSFRFEVSIVETQNLKFNQLFSIFLVQCVFIQVKLLFPQNRVQLLFLFGIFSSTLYHKLQKTQIWIKPTFHNYEYNTRYVDIFFLIFRVKYLMCKIFQVFRDNSYMITTSTETYLFRSKFNFEVICYNFLKNNHIQLLHLLVTVF